MDVWMQRSRRIRKHPDVKELRTGAGRVDWKFRFSGRIGLLGSFDIWFYDF